MTRRKRKIVDLRKTNGTSRNVVELALPPGCFFLALDAFFGQPAKCDVAHTSLPIPPSKVQ